MVGLKISSFEDCRIESAYGTELINTKFPFCNRILYYIWHERPAQNGLQKIIFRKNFAQNGIQKINFRKNFAQNDTQKNHFVLSFVIGFRGIQQNRTQNTKIVER